MMPFCYKNSYCAKAGIPLPDYLMVLMDWLENRMENQSVGAYNQTIVCNFEKSDGIGLSLTCQTQLDSHAIVFFHHYVKCFMGYI